MFSLFNVIFFHCWHSLSGMGMIITLCRCFFNSFVILILYTYKLSASHTHTHKYFYYFIFVVVDKSGGDKLKTVFPSSLDASSCLILVQLVLVQCI